VAGTAGTKPMKGMARVSFLAQAGTIRGELEQGWPLKAIHQRHADKLSMSYAQFCRYVSTYLPGTGGRAGLHNNRSRGSDRPAGPSEPASKPAAAAPLIRQFHYNPTGFDDGDLI
jgi:Family of unknown function (DUF5338)